MPERFVKAMGLALALGWMALPAAAQVRGTISGPAHRAFPIVVSPLAGGGDEARAFDTTLRRDLEISGLFRVLAVPGSAAPDTQGRVDYERWSAMRTRFLVAGTYQPYGEGFTLDVRLYDVIERRILGGKRYEAPRQELARMANRFADEILRILTGRRGPFDSEITFVSSTGGGFKEVWVMRFDGGDLRQLTRNQTINLSPTWAPGARSILYTSYRDGRPGLYEVDVRTQRRRRIQGGAGLVVGGRGVRWEHRDRAPRPFGTQAGRRGRRCGGGRESGLVARWTESRLLLVERRNTTDLHHRPRRGRRAPGYDPGQLQHLPGLVARWRSTRLRRTRSGGHLPDIRRRSRQRCDSPGHLTAGRQHGAELVARRSLPGLQFLPGGTGRAFRHRLARVASPPIDRRPGR